MTGQPADGPLEVGAPVHEYPTLRDLAGAQGRRLGASGWRRITQGQVDLFADATDEHSWIHVDAGRAARGPFGGTIAHGYLVLAVLPALVHDVYHVSSVTRVLNYGLNRVRFPAPLLTGSSIRGQVELLSVTLRDGAAQVVCRVTVESDDSDRPVCVAETITLQYEDGTAGAE